MANLSPVDRLHIEVETVARSASPNMSLTAVSPDGSPHSATVWFAPTDSLDLLTLSAPNRVHSTYIDACNDMGRVALVSGTIRVENQVKSQDCHGLSFEGEASRLTGHDEIEEALSTLSAHNTFTDTELDKYLHHPEGNIPTHGVYLVRPTLWTVFDGRLGPSNPDRLVHIDWPPEQE